MLNDPAEIAGTDCGGGGIEVGRVWNRNGKRDWERAWRGSGNGGAGGGVAGSGAGGGTGAVTYSGVETELVVGNVFGTGSGPGFGSGYGVGGGNGAGAGPGMGAGTWRIGRFRNGSWVGNRNGIRSRTGRRKGNRYGPWARRADGRRDLRHSACADNVWKSGKRSEPRGSGGGVSGASGEIAGSGAGRAARCAGGNRGAGKKHQARSKHAGEVGGTPVHSFCAGAIRKGRSEGERGAADAGPHESRN